MRLVILGAGEHGRVVAEAAVAAGWHVLATLGRDDEGRLPALLADGAQVHLAIGANPLRLAAAARLGGLPWAAIIHPRAVVSPSACVAAGAFIGAGAVVQAGAQVAAHAVVNSGAVVEHDCTLGPGCHVAPGAVLGGAVAVGAGAMIGLGARVRDHLTIGAEAVVGMGAVVVHPVAAGRTVVGVPARERA
jgi:acetyltransferase EpsM